MSRLQEPDHFSLWWEIQKYCSMINVGVHFWNIVFKMTPMQVYRLILKQWIVIRKLL